MVVRGENGKSDARASKFIAGMEESDKTAEGVELMLSREEREWRRASTSSQQTASKYSVWCLAVVVVGVVDDEMRGLA